MDKLPRPNKVHGSTIVVVTGCGKLYVTVNKVDNKLFEVFGQLGKSGGCITCHTSGITRMISLALRYGIPSEEIIEQLEGMKCPNSVVGMKDPLDNVSSCEDGISKAMRLMSDKLKLLEEEK
jgi:ribonucleoside-diphosphate reductase alpha chain